ncbi:MAG: hypothetical protein RLZZ385_210 [Pseudomonadota bacterium]|jgi:DnaJ-class molecular chaperone
MASVADKQVPVQALKELRAILSKPYPDVCNVCNGAGKMPGTTLCPKCKGSGQRLLRLL